MSRASVLCATQLALFGLVLPSVAQAKQAKPADSTSSHNECVILDNDFDIDDMQAIPLVLGNKHVAAVVQSEGYTLPEQAAPAVDQLINNIPDLPLSRKVPILVGGKQLKSPDNDQLPWLGFFRSMMNRANGLLPAVPAPWPNNPNYSQAVASAVSQCKSVEVLVIGPYTSFNNYAPLIASKINRVVIMGQPMGDESRTPGRESFNCSYDLEACKKAMPMLKKYNSFFVDVPRLEGCRDTVKPASHCYSPSLSMVIGSKQKDGGLSGGLVHRGLPGRLREALTNSINCTNYYSSPKTIGRPCSALSTWAPAEVANGPGGESLLWDQTAALFLVDPSKFNLYQKPGEPHVGGLHYEPALIEGSHEKTVKRLREMWTRYTNQSLHIK